MSLESDDQLEQHIATSHGSPKKLRIVYTRDFLLSLSELDSCKRLPCGFDESLLSEFEDAVQERFRSSGSLSSYSLRRNEYGSSPPTRGDTNSYTWNTYGRRDSRSYARSDQNSDSQSDCDSDAGRCYPNQSWRPCQVPEHDGLLGSGSFPRPTGYATGTTAPKFQSGDHYQLTRSNEPYHPPRPYKAMPHSRRGTNDSYNDETFGSSECTSEDRVEEERKRRASFELMRKEQQKAFQEKQKLGQETCKDDFDITLLLEDTKDNNGVLKPTKGPSEPVTIPVSSSDSNKSCFPTPAPTSRPLVPPGFSSIVGEKNVGTKSTAQLLLTEAGNELGGNILLTKGNHIPSGTSYNLEEKQSLGKVDIVEQQLGSPRVQDSVSCKIEKFPSLGVMSKTIGITDDFVKTSKLSEAFEGYVNSKCTGHAKDRMMNRVVDEASPAQSTSIVEKLFSSAVTINSGDSSSVIEDFKGDDRSAQTVQSSKFAQWFFEEAEKKPVHDLPSDRTGDLLSLIVGGEKVPSHALGVKDLNHSPPNFHFQSSEGADDETRQNFMKHIVQDTEPLQNADKSTAVTAVLTCEDLEQSILSEVAGGPLAMPPAVQIQSQPNTGLGQQKVDVDNDASQHLLSLLQKGKGLKDIAPSPIQDHSVEPEPKSSREVDAEQSPNTGKSLTLEALFGAAFMKELQPAGATNSDHGRSGGFAGVDVAETHGLPFSLVGDSIFSMSSHGNNGSSLNQLQQVNPEKIEEHLLSFNCRPEADPPRFPTELGSNRAALHGSFEIQLPEEDSLISVGDPMNRSEMPARNLCKSELGASSDISGKQTALNMPYRKERPIVSSEEIFLHGIDMRESDVHYRNVHVRPPSMQHHHRQSNHWEMFHHLDSHPSNFFSQMNMMALENTNNLHDSSNLQFPLNMMQPPVNRLGNGLGRFDPTAYSPILQQMQMPSDFPPPHHLHGLPSGVDLPPPSSDQATGFRQEASSMQGFPLGQRQFNVNLGGAGTSLQASDVGGGVHPEALQRLFETELRLNPKQLPLFATTGRGQGMYSHELDLGFRHR